jgi:hypothetical protein
MGWINFCFTLACWMGKCRSKDLIVDSSFVEVLNNQSCCSFAGPALDLKEHNNRDDHSCDPANGRQLEMDLTETSKGALDMSRRGGRALHGRKKDCITSQGFCPSSILYVF